MIRLYNPWPEPYTINARSPYGMRVHPISGAKKMHHGIDIAMPVGMPLTAGADGQIAHKGAGSSGGYTLLIRHAGSWHTVYYHLQKPSHLQVGERVTAGQVVAYSGNTGASTGPHLHFELRKSKRWGDTVDPVPHLIGPYREVTQSMPVDPPDDDRRPSRPVNVPPMFTGVGRFASQWFGRGGLRGRF